MTIADTATTTPAPRLVVIHRMPEDKQRMEEAFDQFTMPRSVRRAIRRITKAGFGVMFRPSPGPLETEQPSPPAAMDETLQADLAWARKRFYWISAFDRNADQPEVRPIVTVPQLERAPLTGDALLAAQERIKTTRVKQNITQ